MKSSTITMLSDLVSYQKSEMEKADTEVKRMSNHFKASEQTLIQILNIALQYLKENIKALHRVVLKLAKWVVTAVTDEYVLDVAKVTIPAILSFSLKTSNIVLVK